MKYLIIVTTLFVIGSLFGYLLELFYRRAAGKKWVNPGFLVGPYLPIYGFGVVVLFLISNIEFPVSEVVDIIIKICLIGTLMTLIELIGGLVFVNAMHIQLWDYSDRWGNFKGVICPLFSAIWLVIGSLYMFFVNPFLVTAITWISDNLAYSFFVGGVFGAMIVDCCYSIHLGIKIKQAAGNLTVRYEQFKLDLKNEEKGKGRFFGSIVSLYKANNELKDMIMKHVSKLPSINQWWKKKKSNSDTTK